LEACNDVAASAGSGVLWMKAGQRARHHRKGHFMPSNASFVIDSAQTFSMVIFMGCVPRTKFQSDEVDRDASGTPKWTVGLAVATLPVGNMPATSDVLNATITSPANPCDGLTVGALVQVEGFRVGISAAEQRPGRDGGSRVVGGKPFFSCTAVKPVQQSWSKKSDAA
jgi:hypothetical protein